MKVTFYGASDDLVEVEGCDGADEFNSYELHYMWRGDLIAPGGTEALRVHAVYDGCWAFAVGQVDGDIPLPPWPIRIIQHPGFPGSEYKIPYTVLLEIDAPDGIRLTNIWPERGDDDE